MSVVIVTVALDLDAVGRPFGRGDIVWLGGHRALTHSLLFAVIAAGLLAWAWRHRLVSWRRFLVFAVLAIASHGVLDALTSYGEGVAFLAPFASSRWKFEWQPFHRILPEVVLLWVPAILYRWWVNSEQAVELTRR